MRLFHLPLFAALAGCTTLQTPLSPPGNAEVRILLQRSESDLRQLTLDLADPLAVPAFADASARLDAARIAVLTQVLVAGPETGLRLQGERAALGVTLTLCAEGVHRLAATGRAEAARLARGPFTLACLVPLGVFAGR